MNLTDAIIFAAQAHREQVDKQDQPYVIHLMTVVLASDERDRVVAALHDVVEDGHATFDDLRSLDADDLAALQALTRRPNETYRDYITRLAGNPRAVRIKIHDIDHNLGRLGGLPERTQIRLGRRYVAAATALARLSGQPDLLDRLTPAAWTQYTRFVAYANDFLNPAPGVAS